VIQCRFSTNRFWLHKSWVNSQDAARQFEEQLRAALPCPDEILHADMNPGLSVHTGAGTLAVVFVVAK